MNITDITSLDDERIELYTKYSENQLYHANEPETGYFVAESPEVIKRALDAGYEAVSFLVERENMNEAVVSVMEKCSVPVYAGEHEVLKDIAGYGLTRGMLCLLKRKKLSPLNTLIEDEKVKSVAILEDVMNPTNVGAIMRSAAALNIDAVLLTEGCSDPLYRRAARVSMGTVFQIPWTFIGDDGLDILKAAGFTTIGMALRDNTLDIRDERIANAKRKAILLGSEGPGLKDETLNACDYTVKIPMAHGVDSLNVAAASAVAFWELTR